MPRRVKASELVVREAQQLAQVVSHTMTPFDAWRHIEAPDHYLESQSGKYIGGLELVLTQALNEHDWRLCRDILIDLLKMTKIGRAKAEVAMTSGVDKLHPDTDLRNIPIDKLMEIINQVGGGS